MKIILLMDTATVGHWAFIIGVILAVLAAFVNIPSVLTILFVLGLIVGFLNVTEKESTPFLIAVIALLVMGIGLSQLGNLGVAPLAGTVEVILGNFLSFVSAAALVVAVKQLLVTGTQGQGKGL